ncbi:hypothetical protein [Nocardia tengchongensis]
MNDYLMFERPRPAMTMHPAALAVVMLLAFVFAAGLFLGVLLFGRHEALPTTVVTCPAPGAQVALWPSDCLREAVVTR